MSLSGYQIFFILLVVHLLVYNLTSQLSILSYDMGNISHSKLVGSPAVIYCCIDSLLDMGPRDAYAGGGGGAAAPPALSKDVLILVQKC